MGKRYRRYNSFRKSKGPNPIALLILLAYFVLRQYGKIIISIAVILAAGLIIWFFINRANRKKATENVGKPDILPDSSADISESQHQIYSSKASIMTDCERSFFEAIKTLVEPAYTVQPQINLASVINKESHDRYRNELFRNIDFGIFDKDYKLIVLIEINDESHTTQSRKVRDQKVKAICAEAKIPLITFWTKYGVNATYIKSRLSDYLALPDNDILMHNPGYQDAP